MKNVIILLEERWKKQPFFFLVGVYTCNIVIFVKQTATV